MPISIRNRTKYRLRLLSASASPGRFDPSPPAEVAPRATATLASWARVRSEQKLAYLLESADGAASTGGSRPKRWTMSLHTKPGGAPQTEMQLDNVEPCTSSAGVAGEDGAEFFLEIKDEAAK